MELCQRGRGCAEGVADLERPVAGTSSGTLVSLQIAEAHAILSCRCWAAVVHDSAERSYGEGVKQQLDCILRLVDT